MRKTLAVVLMVFMFACVSPGNIMAGSGNGNGSQSGDPDGSGPAQDRDRFGDCQITTDGAAPLLAGNRKGKRTGPRDGSGPRRDGSCLNV